LSTRTPPPSQQQQQQHHDIPTEAWICFCHVVLVGKARGRDFGTFHSSDWFWGCEENC
jgi:hypothetical protein